MGRDLKWRRLALARLQQYRATELARSAQLTAYKTEHAIPLQEEGEAEPGEDERGLEIEDEITVPPPSVSVDQVETRLWRLLGKVELQGRKVRVKVQEAAATQERLLHQVNQYRAEWAHPPLTLTHLPHHLNVQVSDELVNEFYCDSLDLEESGEVESPTMGVRRGGGGSSSRRATTTCSSRRATTSSRRATTSSSRRARTSSEGGIPTSRKLAKDSEGTDVPPLSLCGSPRVVKTGKTPRVSATTHTSTTPQATKTQRSGGRGRRSVRETPKPPPAPRPSLTLSQVQQIQRARTTHLTLLSQVPEPLQEAAQEVEEALRKCEGEVVGERGRLAWAVLRAGQLVREIGVRVRYRDSEKKLRVALKEKIQEQQMVKDKVLAIRQRIEEYEREQECLVELEEEVDRAFANLVTDNAQFEVQLTRYFESCPTPGLACPDSASSSGESEGGEGGGDDDTGDDDDSGLGTDEARTEGSVGPRPPGCDPAVFSFLTVLRELRWRVAGAAERSRRERALEERRHAAVLRRLFRANHVAHSALASLTALQSERERELGAIPSVVWLRRSQTSGDLTPLTRLPIPNTEVDSMAGVKWMSDGSGSQAKLLSLDHLQQLEQQVAQAKVAQELAALRHREGRAERRALTQQVEQLKKDLTSLRHTYQVTKGCKLGPGGEADMGIVQEKLGTSLDMRWQSKVASQMTRHDTTMTQLQADVEGRTRELRALQKEEAALAAHILALRQEKDHLLYHLTHASPPSTGRKQEKRGVTKGAAGKSRQVGGCEEVERLRLTVARQDGAITALRREINVLRSKTGSVVLPGHLPLPAASDGTSSPPLPHTHTSTQESHTHRETKSAEATLFEANSQPLPELDLGDAPEDNVVSPGIGDESISDSGDENGDTSMSSELSES
nr:cilia- and flagella-associated protein 44-like [Procambarus clarkii]